MSATAGFLVLALYTGASLLTFGTAACLQLARGIDEQRLATWRRRWQSVALLACICAMASAIGALLLQAKSVGGSAPLLDTAWRVLRESRFGSVWLAREILLGITAVLLASAPRAAWFALVSAAAALAVAPLSGHTAALEPAWPWLMFHAAHLLSVAAWWGALPALVAALAGAGRDETQRSAVIALFQRFSAYAPIVMAIVIASGLGIAAMHVSRWPALFGTLYGCMLIVKVGLLLLALALAARLRWQLLPALAAAPHASMLRRCWSWVAAEALVAAAIVLLASQLAQTVPARHDAIFWWLPFRWSIDATWDDAVTQYRVVAGIVALLIAIALVWRARNRSHEWIGASLLALAVALALPALSVPAWPDTYRKPSVPYQAVSVANGERLFATHCVACHGTSAHGDGPQATSLQLPPADLTEPHTALHTAGDLFWWLTHGKPPGIMPGFGAVLSEDDRWDLINFLRTLSLGYQARVLTDRIVPRRPWLPAIDFGYTTTSGASASLKDWRDRSAVLLVFYSEPGSDARLAQLSQALPQLRASHVEPLAVPIGVSGRDTGLPTVADGAAEAVRAYALLRRTLSTLDARDRSPLPAHMEVLIDRFGYVCGRWLPGENAGWQDIERLLAQARALAAEPQQRAPPDDHVH